MKDVVVEGNLLVLVIDVKFLIGLENNSVFVNLVYYAPLFQWLTRGNGFWMQLFDSYQL